MVAGKQQQEAGGSAPQGRTRGIGEWMSSWRFLGTRDSDGEKSHDADVKEIEASVRKTYLAYNSQDLEAFKAGWTDKGFQQAYERPKEKVRDFGLLSLLSFRRYTIGEFSNTAVYGTSAATEVGLTYREVHETHRFSLIREDDTWKIDHDEKVALIPEGAAVVDAKLNFFIIQLERTRLPPGTVAFKISNTDTRPHEFIVKRISESESEDTIGMTKPLKPGENETLILTKLTSGRYVVICNMVTRDIMPHAYGMRTEFLIE